MIKIAIDAMGGDFGPEPILNGVIQALSEYKFKPILVGDKDKILSHLPQNYHNLQIVESSDVIEMEDSATDALKRKESSIFKAINLVKSKEADALVSAGHSGATMSLATLRVGRIKGILRPAIATLMPTTNLNKSSLVLDVGANVDCKSEHLEQFSIMGEAYAKHVMNNQKPKIGLLSNGEEESKGNEVTKETFKLLQKNPNFVGNVEGNNIFDASVDVVVCDGFIGNLVLKTSEGVADAINKILKTNIKKSPIAVVGAVLMKKVFKILKKSVDYAEYGGAPLLGVNGCVIISHGKSNPKAIKNAIAQAIKFAESGVNEHIATSVKKED
jgi:glycerol-3-phosphate acyltransferase PlsX